MMSDMCCLLRAAKEAAEKTRDGTLSCSPRGRLPADMIDHPEQHDDCVGNADSERRQGLDVPGHELPPEEPDGLSFAITTSRRVLNPQPGPPRWPPPGGCP